MVRGAASSIHGDGAADSKLTVTPPMTPLQADLERGPTTVAAPVGALSDAPLVGADDVEAKSKAGSLSSSSTSSPLSIWVVRLARENVESEGISPMPEELRVATQWWSPGLIWFSANTNVLCFSGGTLAPILGLGMRSAMATIVLFSAVLCLPPAYFSIFGKNLGLRQMVFSRYSWGYFPVVLVCILNAIGMIGYGILNSILGGQTLSAVSSSGTLTPTVGIVIGAVVSLVISFSGMKVLHWVERFLWLPVLVGFIVLVSVAGTGPQGLHIPAEEPPLTSTAVLGMGAVLAGFLVSWSPLASDVCYHLSPRVSAWKLCVGVFLGFFLSTAPGFMLGAAFAISATDIPAWSDALAISNGALFDVVLSGPGGVGGFGKFISVLLALSVIGNLAATFYSFGLTFQTMLPFLHRTPRFVWPVLAFAIILPLAIVGASRFYSVLSNFTSIVSYWSSLYVAVVLAEHVVIRRNDFGSYDRAIWNDWRRLPTGASALIAGVLSLGLVIPSMEQVWFTGPIAARIGDIGFEVGFALCFVLYIPLRMLELRIIGR